MPGPPAAATLQRHRPGTLIPRRRLRTAAVAGLLLTVLVAGPACSDDEPDAPTAGDTLPDPTTTAPPPTTADPTTTTTAPPTPEEEVEAAYLDIIETSFRRGQDRSVSDPSIAANHTGASLKVTVDRNAEAIDAGEITRFPSGSPPVPEIISISLVDPTRALVRNCLVDNGQVIEQASGRVVNDEVVSSLIESVLVVEDSRWKLADQTRLERWADDGGCDR